MNTKPPLKVAANVLLLYGIIEFLGLFLLLTGQALSLYRSHLLG